MRPDEREFLAAYLAAWRERKARPRDVAASLRMHPRRLSTILRKLSGYSYGVSEDLGWLYPEGETEIERKLAPTEDRKA